MDTILFQLNNDGSNVVPMTIHRSITWKMKSLIEKYHKKHCFGDLDSLRVFVGSQEVVLQDLTDDDTLDSWGLKDGSGIRILDLEDDAEEVILYGQRYQFTKTIPCYVTMDADADDPNIILKCGHVLSKEGLKMLVQNTMSTAKPDEDLVIKCSALLFEGDPEQKEICNQEVPYQVFRELVQLNDDECKKFETDLSNRMLQEQHGLKHCPECGVFIFSTDKKQVKFICDFCSKEKRVERCWKCLKPWRALSIFPDFCGNTECWENEAAFKKLLHSGPKKDIGECIFNVPSYRACPRCKFIVEHESNCKHVRCPCGTFFCFVCLEVKGSINWSCKGPYDMCPTGIAPVQKL
jgi:hypothetical protein